MSSTPKNARLIRKCFRVSSLSFTKTTLGSKRAEVGL